MAVISAEQRAKEIADRDEMLKNVDSLTDEQKKNLAEQLSVRDRLMLRLNSRKVITKFKDPLGNFTVQTRMLNGKERTKFLELNKMLSTANNDPTKYEAAIAGMKAIVADINLTPGLDREYLLGDEISDDVVLTIILSTFNGAAEAVMEGVASFRPK
jgi:hypothetical protein